VTVTDPQLLDEAGRIASLNRYCVLDSGNETQFDRITALVRSVFKVPIAAVSLVDVDRQWFKSVHGLDVNGTPRNLAFCAHTILTRDALNVSDARADLRFAGNALVTGAPYIRAYLGAPLETPDGYNVGALCAIDTNARSFGPADEAVMASFAALVVDELELRMIGQSDYLTGAKTRRAFMADLEAACAAPAGSRGALIMLDLDHFKRVNDRFGHPAGDELLRAAAGACRNTLRRSDVIGRLGGEEFGILMRGVKLCDAMECAERIRRSIADLRVLPDTDLSTTVSIGIAPVDGDPHATLADADAALYCAKESGRNRCVAMADGPMPPRPAETAMPTRQCA
jgi:diguanylate cyclase (GGDEF)-like protein